MTSTIVFTSETGTIHCGECDTRHASAFLRWWGCSLDGRRWCDECDGYEHPVHHCIGEI